MGPESMVHGVDRQVVFSLPAFGNEFSKAIVLSLRRRLGAALALQPFRPCVGESRRAPIDARTECGWGRIGGARARLGLRTAGAFRPSP